MPILVTAQTTYLVTDSGFKPIDEPLEVTEDGDAVDTPAIENTQNELEDVQDDSDATKAQDELKQFLRWLRKSPDRPFKFHNVPVVYADVLNKFVGTQDYDSARWYAERYLA